VPHLDARMGVEVELRGRGKGQSAALQHKHSQGWSANRQHQVVTLGGRLVLGSHQTQRGGRWLCPPQCLRGPGGGNNQAL
jgi:hypothetical protein